MNKLSFALVGAASLALAACGGQGDDKLGENVSEQYDNAAANLEAQADATVDPVEAAKLDAEAAGKKAEGESLEKAIDKADVNAATVSPEAVNEVTADAH